MLKATYFKDGEKRDLAIAKRSKEARAEYRKRYNTALYLMVSELFEGVDKAEVAKRYGVEFLVCDNRPRLGLELKDFQRSNSYVSAVHEYLLETCNRDEKK